MGPQTPFLHNEWEGMRNWAASYFSLTLWWHTKRHCHGYPFYITTVVITKSTTTIGAVLNPSCSNCIGTLAMFCVKAFHTKRIHIYYSFIYWPCLFHNLVGQTSEEQSTVNSNENQLWHVQFSGPLLNTAGYVYTTDHTMGPQENACKI